MKNWFLSRLRIISTVDFNQQLSSAYNRGLSDARKPMLEFQNSEGTALATITKDGTLEL